jgi:hypothetical protein
MCRVDDTHGSQVSCGLSQSLRLLPGRPYTPFNLGDYPKGLGTERFNKTFPHPAVLPYSERTVGSARLIVPSAMERTTGLADGKAPSTGTVYCNRSGQSLW